ncbi:MAG: hypothetical protein ACRD3S_12525 [Terracidiphilus sp.]
MPLQPQVEKATNGNGHAPHAVTVREQLKRLLAHSLFTNSKRYPVLLAYAVEQTLLGHAGELKERTIGVEAFGRDPSYDVNLDPVVRTTAAEVRKRLIQYYYSPEHAGELVIEMPVGSYVPAFREPSARSSVASAANGLSAIEHQGLSGGLVAPEEPARQNRRWIAIGLACALACLLGFGLGKIDLPRKPSNVERFWAPITSSSSRITYCLGMPADAASTSHIDLSRGLPVLGGLDASDVTTLARSIVPLAQRHDAFRVVSASQIPFAELRESPFVLIGAFDNLWTMRITKDLPFGFETDGQVQKLVDRKSSPQRFWTLEWQVPNVKLAKDYAIVARIHDKVTGQPVIIVAGILGEGTEAASEVVSNPVYLDAVLQRAPKNWEQLNLETVIETDVIEGHPGPPNVLAVQAW